ncbi:NusG domain II-containing protein [Ruminiclostridium josui]|uniref:NusG domain II-containing protein n=1 Tax=Ruminiclostridium josui TaxID=1499 RepID=UPI000466D447|nr:NusG domain II-containing protein [Ruminiclostridium josui]
MLKKGDIILLLVIVLGILSAVFFGREDAVSLSNTSGIPVDNIGITAIIKKNDKVIRRINLTSLNKREVINISGVHKATIVAEKNRICFLESDCPDKICVKTGWLSQPGEIAVCLPNKIIIKLEQDKNQNVDGVVK